MRKRLLFLLALVLLLALAACGGGGGEESQGDTSNETNNAEEEASPAEGGTVTIASNSEPGNLNPMVWATIPDTIVTDMVYDALVVPDDELKMVGSLAKDWDVSEDGTSYTFYLEEGITWHDGEPFTAEDVEFTFTSIADPRYDAEAYWRAEPIMGAEEYREGNADSIEGIEVIDDNTIKFTIFLRAHYWLRSEEHTSELQSRGHLVCRLLLEKKKTTRQPAIQSKRNKVLICKLLSKGQQDKILYNNNNLSHI